MAGELFMEIWSLFALAVTAEDGNLLSKRDRRAEMLHKILYLFKIDTWTKEEIANDLPNLISGRISLLEYPGLKDLHISTLANLLRI